MLNPFCDLPHSGQVQLDTTEHEASHYRQMAEKFIENIGFKLQSRLQAMPSQLPESVWSHPVATCFIKSSDGSIGNTWIEIRSGGVYLCCHVHKSNFHHFQQAAIALLSLRKKQESSA